MRYRLNQGHHHGLNLQGEEQDWNEGEIIETNQDLSRMSGPNPKEFKFTKLDDVLVVNPETTEEEVNSEAPVATPNHKRKK